MSFFIQCSSPQIAKNYVIEGNSLRDCIEDLFPMRTEEALICWNGIRIPLSYKYDISLMVEVIAQRRMD